MNKNLFWKQLLPEDGFISCKILAGAIIAWCNHNDIVYEILAPNKIKILPEGGEIIYSILTLDGILFKLNDAKGENRYQIIEHWISVMLTLSDERDSEPNFSKKLLSIFQSNDSELDFKPISKWKRGKKVKSDTPKVNLNRLIVRALPVEMLHSLGDGEDKQASVEEVCDSFGMHKVDDYIYLAVGENAPRTISTSSSELIKGVKNWKRFALKNISSMIGKDYSLGEVSSNTGLPLAATFFTDMEILFFSFPMSQKHNKLLAKILNANLKDIVYLFDHRNAIGQAFSRRSIEAIDLMKSYANSKRMPFSIYQLNNEGFLESTKLS